MNYSINIGELYRQKRFLFFTAIVFFVTIFFTNYLLISNKNYIKNYLDEVETKMLEKGEDVSDVIEMTESVLKNPGYIITISFNYTFTFLRNFSLFFLLVYISISVIQEKFIRLNEYLKIIIPPLWIITTGLWINLFLKLILFESNTISSLGFFFRVDDNQFLTILLRNIELFSFLFLTVKGRILAKEFNESMSITIPLTFGNYLLLVSFSAILNFYFSFL